MQLGRIMLMHQQGKRNIENPADEVTSITLDVDENAPELGKPWPRELTFILRMFSPREDEVDTSTEFLFEAVVHYAVEFSDIDPELSNSDVIDQEATLAWKYARTDFIQILHIYDLPGSLLPMDFTFGRTREEDTDNS